MAARSSRNGLQEAMTLLLQNQAMFVRDMAEIRKDFGEIKEILMRHEQRLVRVEQILAGLPDAILAVLARPECVRNGHIRVQQARLAPA
ncbi:MAG: hypothetical protein HY654_07845 [Acidobacteria bacterium]|nr:hypothetical protein [Acidobacteriota bacterium]